MSETSKLVIGGKMKRMLAPGRPGGRGRLLAAIRATGGRASFVLAALVLVAAASGAVLWGVNRGHDREVDAGQSAVSFAKTAIPKLLSYDVTTVGELPSANASLMTGKFGEEYAQLVRSKLAPGVRQGSLTNETDVVTSAVVSASESKVTLLMFLNQVSSSKGMSTPATTGSRVSVVLVRGDGDWQIDQINPI